MGFNSIMKELMESYSVKDINTDQAKFIFVLESPHVQELKHGVPVAGTSGLSMTRNLLGENFNKPIGLLLKHVLETGESFGSLQKIGLMNICQIPMQRTAYQEKSIEKFDDFFRVLEGVRTSNHKHTYKDPMWNSLQLTIVNFYIDRLKPLNDKDITLIPCGRFAQKFLKLALNEIENPRFHIIQEVPHPSYNSWSRERYKPVIGEMKTAMGISSQSI